MSVNERDTAIDCRSGGPLSSLRHTFWHSCAVNGSFIAQRRQEPTRSYKGRRCLLFFFEQFNAKLTQEPHARYTLLKIIRGITFSSVCIARKFLMLFGRSFSTICSVQSTEDRKKLSVGCILSHIMIIWLYYSMFLFGFVYDRDFSHRFWTNFEHS